MRGFPGDGASEERRCRPAERGRLPPPGTWGGVGEAGSALPAEISAGSGGGGQVSGGESPLRAAFPSPGEPGAPLPPPPFPSAPAGRAPPRTWGRAARGFPVRGAVLA